jgi:imidazolonepropionase-like amidohydrolase
MSVSALRNACFLTFALLSALPPSAARAATIAQEELYLANANLVDPAARQVRRGNLLIRNGVVVATPGKPPAGFTGRSLDLTGKWVIPGLIDLHTHSFGNQNPTGRNDAPRPAGTAQRVLYAGVTALLDLFGGEDQLFLTREQQRAGKLGGAELFTSLSCLTATNGHCTEYGIKTRTMDSPDEARRVIADLRQKHPDVVKIVYETETRWPSISKETFFAAVAAANESGLKTVIHINSWQGVRDAVEAGAAAVTHVPNAPIPDDVAPLMAARKVASIPTLAVETDLVDFVFDREVLDNPLARALTTPAVIDAYRSAEFVERIGKSRAESEARNTVTLRSVKTMADAGVTILAGTDSGNIGTLQGYSMHRELLKMVAAGLSSWQALAAATTEAGTFLGRRYGVKPGDEANLVVLDASPIDDIRNTQRIAYVIHNGAVVDREEVLASELAGLRR